MNHTLSDDQFARLNAELEDNPVAMDYYLHFVTTYAGLMDLSQASPVPQVLSEIEHSADHDASLPERREGAVCAEGIHLSPHLSEDERRRRIEEYAREQLDAYLEQQKPPVEEAVRRGGECVTYIVESCRHFLGFMAKVMRVGAAIAVLALLVGGITFAIWWRMPVATLQDSIEAKWSRLPEGNQLRRGWMQLDEGYAKLQFKQGAEVILQAPCRIHLDAKNRMQLTSGAVTSLIPPQAIGFTLVTPNTLVKDYGTEFGVRVDAAHTSEVQVFQGEVGVSSTRQSQTPYQYRLKQGQSTATQRNGIISINKIPRGIQSFIRRLSHGRQLGIPGKRMSLADVVGGGNGFGTGVIGGYQRNAQGSINPITGFINDMTRPDGTIDDTLVYDQQHFKRPCQYTLVPELAYVDGVFVPNGDSNDVVVSSMGHCLTACPNTDGMVKWNIINGWRYRDLSDPGRNNPSLARASGISMHANSGITFDLQAIANAMPGVCLKQFFSYTGIPLTYAPDISEVDIWVLVDGDVRYLKEDVTYSQGIHVGVDLTEADRFLTLMVTDSQTEGKADFYSNMDWCFWEEPTLVLGLEE